MRTTAEYKALITRINSASDIESLEKVDTSLDRLYNAGVLSERELYKLDHILVSRMITLECEV